LAALAVLPWAVVSPFIEGEAVPMALTGALFEAPWADARPAEMTAPESTFESLQVRRYYPWFSVLSQAALAGDSVSWNTFEACGTPFLAQWETRALSPFSLFFYFLPLHAAMAWSLLTKLIVAGWATFYALRRLGFERGMAMLAAVAFQLSGPVLFWAPFPLSDVVVWLPLLMLYAERAALGQLRAWPLGAMTVGLMALGGDPAALVASLTFAAAYVALRSMGGEGLHPMRAGLLVLGAATLGGLALAGLQWVPWLEFRGLSARTGPELATRLSLGGLAGLAIPGLSHPDNADLRATAYMLYTGMAPTLLLVLWVAVRRFAHALLKKRADIMLVLGLVTLMLALLLPRLPGGLGAEHFLLFHGFCMAYVAASATTEWLELNAEQCKAALVRMLMLVPALWGGGAVVLALHASRMGAGGTVRVEIIVAVLGIVAVLLLLAVTMFLPRARLLGYGASAITACALVAVMPAAAPKTPGALVFPQTEFVDALAAADARIAGSGGLDRWPTAVHGIPQAGNPSGVATQHYAALRDAWQESPLLLRLSGSPALLLTKNDIRETFGPLRPLLRIGHIFTAGAVLFDDLEAPARTWTTTQWRPVAERPEPATLEPGAAPLVETTEAPEGNGPLQAVKPVERVRVAPGEISVAVNEEQRVLLVLMETWYPGWQVIVDGRRAAPLRVNSAFMGVVLEPGEHQVSFVYHSRSQATGLGLSLAAGLTVALGLLLFWRDLWRARKPL
jgi:hypothetical protein